MKSNKHLLHSDIQLPDCYTCTAGSLNQILSNVCSNCFHSSTCIVVCCLDCVDSDITSGSKSSSQLSDTKPRTTCSSSDVQTTSDGRVPGGGVLSTVDRDRGDSSVNNTLD